MIEYSKINCGSQPVDNGGRVQTEHAIAPMGVSGPIFTIIIHTELLVAKIKSCIHRGL